MVIRLLPTLSADEALELLVKNPEQLACVDVRSEGEFEQGAIPYFKNIPILTNEERHLVGLCYKNKGQAESIELGHQLVTPHKDKLIKSWHDHLGSAPIPVVTCWRGGLRSQITAQWLSETGLNVHRVAGGSKALRQILIEEFNNLPPLIVIAGPTGARKTKLIQKLDNKIDLEALAHHRGSAFGRDLLQPQPSQATFENNLALALRRNGRRAVFLEDESKSIGSVHLPLPFYEKINHAPIVKIKMDIEERVANLFEDYITEPLARGVSPLNLGEYYSDSLTRIKSKLGGLKEQQVRSMMREAFETQDRNKHHGWIHELLANYYDKTYAHSMNRASHTVAYEGDWQSCLRWIQNQYASPKR